MRSIHSSLVLAAFALSLGAGCALQSNHDNAEGSSAGAEDELKGPGALATDKRVPEMGDDLRILKSAKLTMAQGVALASKTGPVIEAKFEIGDDKKLSLSLYPAGKDASFDAERNVFQELAGDPTVTPFQTNLEVFADQEHLTRSARDLTLLQLSSITLADAVYEGAEDGGTVYWAIPTIRRGRAGFGVYSAYGAKSKYRFIDGQGSWDSNYWDPCDLGTGPGAGATDARTPELGDDLSVLLTSKTTMSQALAKMEAKYGGLIEAKFEIGDDGKLSLSIYPTGKGVSVDAERNTFFELAGDPTASTYAPTLTEFKVPDVEHLTRSARDLTLVQTASITLREAVAVAERSLRGGFVYWAIPTIRDTRAGYGVYVYGRDHQSHYFFIS
jgi:hypothetical protein